MILMASVFYSGALHASAGGAKGGDKKALPLEMVITADELRDKQLKKMNFVLFDARSEKSYDKGHIQGAILPRTEEFYRQEDLYMKELSKEPPDADKALKDNMKKYSKGTPIVTYCSGGSCQASADLALELKQQGFTNVEVMEDGFPLWEKKGYPVTGDTKIHHETK